MRILHIDDDPMQLITVHRWLRDHDVTGTTDAATVVQAWEFDAIVTDLEMPGFDGRRVLQTLTSIGYPANRIALLSASREGRNVAKTFGVKWLQKPASAELSAWIEAMENA